MFLIGYHITTEPTEPREPGAVIALLMTEEHSVLKVKNVYCDHEHKQARTAFFIIAWILFQHAAHPHFFALLGILLVVWVYSLSHSGSSVGM